MRAFSGKSGTSLALAMLTVVVLPNHGAAQEAGPAGATAARPPRVLTAEDQAKLRRNVQTSKARSTETARQLELQRQEQARQWEEAQRLAAAESARQAEENALADAEFEEERARKAAAWNAAAREREQALADSLDRLNDTVANVQAKQAEAARRSSEAQRDKDLAERRRQVELIDQATRRQYAEGDRLAAQRQQSEQQRAQAQAAQAAQAEKAKADRLREQAAAERARLRQQANNAPAAAKAPSTAAPSPAGGATERTFLGKSCAEGRAGAATFVGNGTFSVVSETMGSDGYCRVRVQYTSGTSTGIRQ